MIETSGPCASAPTSVSSSTAHKKPASLLRRSPRRRLPLGPAPPAGNPPSGPAQPNWSRVRETVKEIEVPVYVQVEKPKPLPFAEISDDELLNYGVPAEWLPDVRRADDNSLLDLTDHLPDRGRRSAVGACHRRHAASADPYPARNRPVRASRRPPPLPRHARRGGAGTRPRLPVGKMGRLSASGPARTGRAHVQRPCPRIRLSRHRQDHRRPPPCCPPGAHQSRRPRSAHNFLRNAGQCPPQ